MAWAWLDHFDHTVYMSFQFVGFSSSLNVALRFRGPHLLQVSIKANPFVLFLVCLHLFVYLLCLILSGTLQLCTLLAYFPFPVFFACTLVNTSCTSSSLFAPTPCVTFGPSERVGFLQREEMICQKVLLSASDLIWCETVKTTAREVCSVLSNYGELQREVSFHCRVRIIKVVQTDFQAFRIFE